MKAIAILLTVLLMACASVPAEKLFTLEKGMDRKAVIADLGQPVEVNFSYNAYVITYNFGMRGYDLYFDTTDKLYSWEPIQKAYRPAPVSGVITVNKVN